MQPITHSSAPSSTGISPSSSPVGSALVFLILRPFHTRHLDRHPELAVTITHCGSRLESEHPRRGGRRITASVTDCIHPETTGNMAAAAASVRPPLFPSCSCSASSRCRLLSLLIVVLASLSTASGSPHAAQVDGERDLMVDLPGQPKVRFRQYAGYVPLPSSPEKALFYWFFEADVGSADEAQRKPLLLWMNGGPGCSSVAYGAAQELGPFLVRNPGGLPLKRNPYAWNKAANLLFVESPVGVGFSYTNRSSDLHVLGDTVAAKDAYDFLIGWLGKFPRFKGNEFYIAGESYAGHYVPQLADLIYQGNQKKKQGDKDAGGVIINFKGFMIGNAVLNDGTDQVGMVEYAWSHAIISDGLYTKLKSSCGDFTMQTDSEQGKKNGGNTSRVMCLSSMKKFSRAYQDIDIYSIYTNVCLRDDDGNIIANTTSVATTTHRHRHRLAHSSSIASPLFLFSHPELWDDDDTQTGTSSHARRPISGIARAGGGSPGYDPCAEDYVTTYFNRPDVQRALHANTTRLNYSYSPCSEVIEGWNDSADTVLPILKKLSKAGIRIWVYSGDTDGRVPVTSTRYSLAKMGLEEADEWRAWYHRRQVAGWVVQYQGGITFATVRGAGHQVPAFKPDQSLSLLYHFLKGSPLPRRSKDD